jgi:hypothetical protein
VPVTREPRKGSAMTLNLATAVAKSEGPAERCAQKHRRAAALDDAGTDRMLSGQASQLVRQRVCVQDCCCSHISEASKQTRRHNAAEGNTSRFQRRGPFSLIYIVGTFPLLLVLSFQESVSVST